MMAGKSQKSPTTLSSKTYPNWINSQAMVSQGAGATFCYVNLWTLSSSKCPLGIDDEEEVSTLGFAR